MGFVHDGVATVHRSTVAERDKGSEAPALVSISFHELVDPNVDLNVKISEAFGAGGLGALTVSDVPGMEAKRKRLLKLAQKFSVLPEEVKTLYEDPASSYNFGWSHGKESLADGQKDVHKGSFYANPQVDSPGAGDVQLAEKYPAYFRPNIWPKEHLDELELAFKDLGKQIIEVGMMLTARCDSYVGSIRPGSGGSQGKLLSVLQRSRIPKGRLLHYFPPDRTACSEVAISDVAAADILAADADCAHSESWCGWHTDHGSLTGLTSAMYLDATGAEVQNPDPLSGLYIRSRCGGVIKANIPPSHLAYQVGEAMQIHSGGLLQATPHYVRAPTRDLPGSLGISRNTFAVFMQPGADEPMDTPPGVSHEDVAVGQWSAGQDFGQFSIKTFEKYYQ